MQNARVIAVIAAAATASAATATTGYGVTGMPGGGARLVTFDSNDPSSLTVVGDTGLQSRVLGLEYVNDQLLVWDNNDFTGQQGGGGLYQLDPNTGAATFIGGQQFSGDVDDLAYNPANDTLYALARVGGSSDIFEINPNTGAINNQSDILNSSQNRFRGFAFDATGTAYLIDEDDDRLWTAESFPIGWLIDSISPPGVFGQLSSDQGFYIDHQNTGDALVAANNSISSDLRTISLTDGTLLEEREWGKIPPSLNQQPDIYDLVLIPTPAPAALLIPAALSTATRRRRST